MKRLTVEERIILHLYKYRVFRRKIEVPMALSQHGIAQAIGVLRGAIPRAVNTLHTKGEVEIRLAHVVSQGRRRKVYALTDAGEQRALALAEELKGAEIEVDGRITTLGKVLEAMEDPPYILDAALAVEDGRLDPTKLSERADADASAAVGQTGTYMAILSRAPRTRYFFGRATEMERMAAWWAEAKSEALVVYGLPGIGKSTLAARFARSRMDESHVTWVQIREWDTPKSFLVALAEIFTHLNRDRLMRAAKAGRVDLPTVREAISRDGADLRILVVLDDVQNASNDLSPYLRFLFSELGTVAPGAEIRLLATSREVPPLYSRREVEVTGRVRELHLLGLDARGARELLRARGIADEAVIRTAVEVTGGHPLALELVSSEGGSVRFTGLETYLMDEVYKPATRSERLLLAAASVFRRPVPRDWLLWLGHGVDDEAARAEADDLGAINALTARALLCETADGYETHELVGNFIRTMMSPQLLKDLHSRASSLYLAALADRSKARADDVIEAAYHLISAGDAEAGVRVGIEWAALISQENQAAELLEVLGPVAAGEPERSDPMLDGLIGQLQWALGNLKEASVRFERVVEHPEGLPARSYAHAWAALGRVAERSGAPEGAVAAYERGIAAAGSTGDPYLLAALYLDAAKARLLAGLGGGDAGKDPALHKAVGRLPGALAGAIEGVVAGPDPEAALNDARRYLEATPPEGWEFGYVPTKAIEDTLAWWTMRRLAEGSGG